MAVIFLKDIAHGRSGDKGNRSNICIFAREPKYYDIIKEQVTAERVKEHFGDVVKGKVVRYDVPTLTGFNFVMDEALGGGATNSLRFDNIGKCMASALMRMKVVIDD